ncbi:RNA-binding, RBD [Venustampulla echinocandica]|uniref:Nucleolar protein 12 n=1 Tax=Venustampulla echinocandica TaxID=2656787 RepID=A0A370TS90_9HELO|nr:RNA-binding, RBD [Venustampulla echinocandica]RDL38399.1 RNA-binding, RBD [Venustampulla echinocandica]
MGKRSRKNPDAAEPAIKGNGNSNGPSTKTILAHDKAIDPSLASLFASSAGPVKAPPKARYEEPPPARRSTAVEVDDASEMESGNSSSRDDDEEDEELSSVDEDLEDNDISGLSDDDDEENMSDEEPQLDRLIEATTQRPERKRKRKAGEGEDLEAKYMQKLLKLEEQEEEALETERRQKRQRLAAEADPDTSEVEEDVDEENDGSNDDESEGDNDSDDSLEAEGITSRGAQPSDIPVHESLAPSKDALELDKASRTVFLANVSTEAITSKSAKKTLLAHMGSFLDSLPDPPPGKPAHEVESIRFRSTAYAGTSLPKKAAFVKKDLMAATTKSTNAYLVYSTAYAAREAVKRLNATIILDRHLRVDGVAHPAKTDHRRCVFVGNLGFVDDESMLDQGGENERKRSKIPSDIEEGLWRQFGKAGAVESVRVVRDEKTRVGKGFAYVQFKDPNSVEAALLFNEKKYPPMLPRILRVVRAKAIKKTANASRANFKNPKPQGKGQIYNPKVPGEEASLHGRAGKLLGRAGAAKLRKEGSGANGMVMGKRGGASAIGGVARTPENIIFEGYRASAKSGKPKDLKMGGGKKGKPANRGAKRASAWKKTAGKKDK